MKRGTLFLSRYGQLHRRLACPVGPGLIPPYQDQNFPSHSTGAIKIIVKAADGLLLHWQ